jgi:hypothetical protein
MLTSALRADQYLDVQIKCVVGALNLLESQLATAPVAVRRGWWLNKGTHERPTYSLPQLTRTGCPLRNRTRPERRLYLIGSRLGESATGARRQSKARRGWAGGLVPPD